MKKYIVRSGIIGGLAFLVGATAWVEAGNGGKKRDGDQGRDGQEEGCREGRRPHFRPIPFRKLDGDKDGKVTFEEWVEAHDVRMEKRLERAKEKGKDRVPTDEMLEKREERLERIFSKIDADESDDISREEYREGLKRRHEKKRDGKRRGPRGGGDEGGGDEDGVEDAVIN